MDGGNCVNVSSIVVSSVAPAEGPKYQMMNESRIMKRDVIIIIVIIINRVAGGGVAEEEGPTNMWFVRWCKLGAGASSHRPGAVRFVFGYRVPAQSMPDTTKGTTTRSLVEGVCTTGA